MKKTLIIAAIAGAAMISACSQDISPEPKKQEPVTLKVDIGLPGTKAILAAGSTADLNANTVQVFVFNSDGTLDNSSGVTPFGDAINLSVIPGNKTVWALVNAPAVSGIETETGLRTSRTLLSDNTLSSLVMSGSKAVEVSGNGSVTVTVKHVAAKVVLDKVTRSFTNPYYSGIPMTIKRIYMSNVAADCDYQASGYQPTLWNCQMGVLGENPQDAALLLDDNLNISLSEGTSYETAHTFYVYPNPTTEDNDDLDAWSPRMTRLVLECVYNGRTCYYPITIPGPAYAEAGGTTTTIDRNKVYHISGLTLKRPGSTSSEQPGPEVSSNVDCTFDISVSEWEDDYMYNEVF
ncbi:MAG: hypothetical protein J5533_06330 [Bacteroidales bacterium]|nr:hypothetical protein [Bacteroidales bacterium]